MHIRKPSLAARCKMSSSLAVAMGLAAAAALADDIAWKWDDSRHVDAAPVVAEGNLSGASTGSIASRGAIARADGKFSSHACEWDDSWPFTLDTWQRNGTVIMLR